MDYIDMHCDTLMQAFLGLKKDVYHLKKTMVDVERLKAGGAKAQFFAIFLPPLAYKAKLGPLLPSDDKYIEKLHKILMNTIEAHPNDLALARSFTELEENKSAGKVSAVLTIEDGRAVEGDMAKLKRFYGMGVRLISLTWNAPNCFGSPNSKDRAVMETGLTPFGKAAVEYMNELGMLIDVSHLSDGGFRDVAALSKRPFVASHSNCRALSSHQRNLTDDMLRTLANAGGVAGLNFGPEFLNADLTCKDSTVALLVQHARHMADVGGVDCVALGSDFDGVSGNLEIDSTHKMPLLLDALEKAGFTPDEMEKIAYKNVERVMHDALN